MATVTFDLVDQFGREAGVGDIVEVDLPCIEKYNNWGEVTYYRPEMTVRAKVMFPPSSGLQIKILDILDVDDEYAPDDFNAGVFHTIEAGQTIGFRRRTWVWRKVDGKATG